MPAIGKSTRHISDATKLAVRQKCGFGCIFCGIPIFEYDHLIEFAEGGENTVENLNLLCPDHHAKKTKGILSRSAVEQRAKAPVNLSRGKAEGLKLELGGTVANIVIGSNKFKTRLSLGYDKFTLIEINEKCFGEIYLEDGWLSFDLILTNLHGENILVVKKGELSFSTGVWDFSVVGSKFSLKEKKSSIELVMKIEDDTIILERGSFAHKGRGLDIYDDGCVKYRYVFQPPMMKPMFQNLGEISHSYVEGMRYGIRFDGKDIVIPSHPEKT
jgi:hypothetical protein